MEDLSDLIPGKISDRMTAEKIRIFLEFLADGGSVTGAARKIGFTPQRMYQLRDEYPAFRQAWANAYESGTDEFEDSLNRLRKSGNVAAVIFGLKCRRPEIYNPHLNLKIPPDRTGAPSVSEAIVQGEKSAAEPLTFRTAPALTAPDETTEHALDTITANLTQNPTETET